MTSDWPKQVETIYRRHEAIIGEMAMCYGPAHIVWADGNFSDADIRFCLEVCDKPCELSAEEVAVIRQSLLDLLALPEDVRWNDCEEAQ